MATPIRPTQTDEVRDLQLVLNAGGLSALVMGAMVILSGDLAGVLHIPTTETAVLAVFAGAVALAGMLALRRGWPPRRIGWAIMTAYTFIVTAAIHYTGGPQTPMPALYVLIAVAASYVIGRRGANLIAVLSAVLYALLLILEYSGLIVTPQIWGTPFDVPSKGVLLVVNWLTVITPTIVTAFMSGALAARLKTRNQQLHQSEDLREGMVAMLVHDLRNPLTALLGGLDIINLMLSRQMNDDQRHLLDNARRSGRLLLAMIGDMLDVTKMEAGQLTLKPQPIDLEGMLIETIEQVYALAEMEGLTVELEPVALLPPVRADRQLVQRVLANLVSNAIKHTPPGGTITLAARRHYDRFVAVSVRDTGEGIPVEQHQRIFEKFGQVEKGGLTRRGTGLGLTFCKMAVEAQQGQIWVESEAGKGSTFSFTLPIAAASEAAPLPAKTPVTAP
jgi:signal transduction histidine kinase